MNLDTNFHAGESVHNSIFNKEVLDHWGLLQRINGPRMSRLRNPVVYDTVGYWIVDAFPLPFKLTL
jgi:hypothetical protein